MKKHADNAKKDTRKSQLPVSKNFYSCVTGRVCESLGLIGRPDAVGETMALIDRYMTDGTVPSADTDTAVLLTFSLLRAEIDKAIQRSCRARQRTVRKNAELDSKFSAIAAILAAAASNDMPAAADEEEAGDPAPLRPRNRRERRLYEQELRRIARRQSRKKGFAYSGDF